MLRPDALDRPCVASADALLALFQTVRLSPAQRRIARTVLDRLDEAAFLSSTELAELAGVSQPSVTRFAVAVGFSGFQELREALRRILMGGGATMRPQRSELQDAIADEAAHVAGLGRLVGEGQAVPLLARQLVVSQPLVVLGLRASAALAQYFGYFAQRLCPEVRLVLDGGTALDVIHQAEAAGASWLLAFVLPRYPVDSVQALRFARSLGMRTAVVADTMLLPFGDSVDVPLAAPVGSRLVFDSYAAPTALAMALLHEMANALPDRTQARLEAYEQMAEEQGLFFAE